MAPAMRLPNLPHDFFLSFNICVLQLRTSSISSAKSFFHLFSLSQLAMESIDEQQPKPSAQGPKTGDTARPSTSSFLGKHRMAVAISHLHTQINLIKEELDELQTLGGSSIVCNELISSVDSVPDPLLPVTKGPADVSWDRWFRGAHNSRTYKLWI